MAQSEIKLIISGDSSGAVAAINKVSRQTETITSQIKKHWLGMGAAVAGATAVIYKAWDLMGKAADFEEQRRSLNILAGQYNTTAGQIIKSIKDITDGQVSMAKAADMGARALNMGLNP